MSTTGTSLVVVKAALVTALKARSGLSGIPVTYSKPRRATEVTETEGGITAIWLGGARGETNIPYLTGPASHQTEETYSFEVVCQAIVRSSDVTGDGQQAADTQAVVLEAEVASCLAADPTVASSNPLARAAAVTGWTHQTLPSTANAWGALVTITVQVLNQIPAPS